MPTGPAQPGGIRNAAPALFGLALAWPLWLHRLGINDYDDGVSNEVIFAQSPLSQILFDLRWADQSPLYFVLLHFWTLLGRDPFAVKLMNVALLSLVPLLVWLIARRSRASTSVAAVAVGIAALSPLCLWMARNGRMYVPQLVLSLWSVAALLRVLDTRRARDAAWLVVACALNVYNHFFGFLISALVFGIWALESAVSGSARRTGAALRGPLLAGAALAVLVFPQVLRAVALTDRPPEQASWSIPGASVRSMEQVQAFWFVNASWSGLRKTLPFADELFYICAYGLAILGVAAAPPRAMRVTLLWFAVPIITFGALAGSLDLRARYLAFVAPLLWIAIARGAVGPLPAALGPGRLRAALGPLRRAMFAVFVASTLWLLWHKLPERYAEWTRVLSALDRVYRPGSAVYMDPGTYRGIPPAIVAHAGLQAGLGKLHRIHSTRRAEFMMRVGQRQDIVFLIHRRRIGDEQEWMAGALDDAGWHRVALSAWNAEARVYSREPIERFALRYRVAADDPTEELLSWVGLRLADPYRVPAPDSRLHAALVAQLAATGELRESVVYGSQRGESGTWHLGERDTDAAADVGVRLSDESRRAWRVRVPAGQTTVLALPREIAVDPADWSWGVRSSEDDAARFEIRLFAGDRPIGRLVGPDRAGWLDLLVNEEGLADEEVLRETDGPLTVLISHDGEASLQVYLVL